MGAREPEGPQAATPAPKRPATVVARSAVGARDAAMLWGGGGVDDLAQRMDGGEGDKCGNGDEVGEKVKLQELAMIGSVWGVELGAPFFFVLDRPPKKALGMSVDRNSFSSVISHHRMPLTRAAQLLLDLHIS